MTPTTPNAPPRSNHPLVRVTRQGQAVRLDVAECAIHLSPSEALSLLGDLEKVLRAWPALP